MRNPNKKEYALYKGEELLTIGTLDEIAKELGVKKRTVSYYGTKSHNKRSYAKKGDLGKFRTLVELEEE